MKIMGGNLKLFLLLVAAGYFNPASSQVKQKEDTLSKYSYLLIYTEKDPNTVGNFIPTPSHATCFFIRRNGKLYLVSAYHVLTNYDLYAGKPYDKKVDAFFVRYFDSVGKPSGIFVPVQPLKSMFAFFLTLPDICIYRCDSLAFINKNIKSIESMVEPLTLKANSKTKIKIISFGFPVDDTTKFNSPDEFILKSTPQKYIGLMADTSSIQPGLKVNKNFNDWYSTVTPLLINGRSGSPVFLQYTKKKKSWHALLGVQSGATTLLNTSFVVNYKLLINEIDQSK